MRRAALVFALLVLGTTACADEQPQATDQPTPRLEVSVDALEEAALELPDLGEGWRPAEDDAPVTLQIGGRVGPSNIRDAENEITTAFEQTAGTGYVSNSIFLVESGDIASAWLDQHAQATRERWTQERQDGGGARYERTGDVSGLPSLGDETFSAAIDAVVEDGEGNETSRKIEYVVYRVDRIVAFVVAQDVGVATYARRQEAKVSELVG